MTSQPAHSLSPRRRRLRWTAVTLAAALAASTGFGVWLHQRSRPAQYRPDERTADITENLARGLPPDAPRPRFTDVTQAAGLASFHNFAGDRTSQMPEDMGPGLAWGDFDNDGDDDLFLVSQGGSLNLPKEQLAPCALFENLGDGTFRRVAGLPEARLHGQGAAWADYDGDGFLDLAVAGYHALLLFRNEGGTGRFTRDERLPNPPGFWSAVSWGDFDNDRRPDLYVCGYLQYTESDADRHRGSMQEGVFIPYTLNPASYPPALNCLYHQNPDGSFTDVAAGLGVTNPTGRSLGALWHDFDDDGWLDLYVANDVSDNAFYRNTGGRFEDISHTAWVADYRSAMGLAAGDFDRDGDDDLFITHWVAQENALYANQWANYNGAHGVMRPSNDGVTAASPSSNAPTLQHSDTGSSSLLRFVDVNEMKGLGQVSLPMVGWGTEFVDFDGDGWLDLIVANGNTIEHPGPMPKRLKAQPPMLFWNRCGGFFHDLAPLCPPLAREHVSRGLAVADYDNDGDMDVAIAHLGEGVQLLRNDMQTGHWLKVRLRSRNARGDPNGFGDGAKVIAHVAGAPLRRAVGGVSYLSQSSRTLHFGLGSATKVDRLEVRWHAGKTNVFENLPADTTYEITEGEPAPRSVAAVILPVVGPGAPPGGIASPSSTAPETASPKPGGRVPPSPAGGTPAAMEKQRLLDFWNKQRAAMNALKVEKDFAKAIPLFQRALELNPGHEDARYYLAQCLAAQGDVDGALAHLDELTRLNPQSQRAFQQWGSLRAAFARHAADLEAAERHLERAHAINPEETGALLLLGEVALLRGDCATADLRFADACRTNPRAAGGFFLRGYLAWRRGDTETARGFLAQTRAALGKDWQPKGATSEGDVKQKQHVEATPLTRFWEAWDGREEPATAFATLEARLKQSADMR